MDRFWQQLLNHASRGFNRLTVGGLQIMHPRLDRSLRDRLPQRRQTALRFLEQIFQGVISVGLIPGHPGAFRQVKAIPLHGARVTVAARGQEKLDWLSLFGHHQMQHETVKEALFAGLSASEGFTSVQLRGIDAVVVAGNNREAVNDVERVLIQAFPGLAQHQEQGQNTSALLCKRRLKRLLGRTLISP